MLERWIDAAINAGLLAVASGQYRTVSLTERGRDIMAGRLDNWPMTAPFRSPNTTWRREFGGSRGVFPRRARFRDEWWP